MTLYLLTGLVLESAALAAAGAALHDHSPRFAKVGLATCCCGFAAFLVSVGLLLSAAAA